jgi:hypothetical protein
VGDDYPALLRARRRRQRWSEEDRRLYQRHRWRSEGFHGEAKTWHGLARAVRRGLANMKIQAYLTAAAINLKRLATALLALLPCWIVPGNLFAIPRSRRRAVTGHFFNDPSVHFMRNVLAHAGRQGRRVVAAFIGTAFVQDDAEAASKQWRAVADQLRPKVSKLAAFMDEAEADVLAFMSFPKDHRPKIHSTDEIDKRLFVN